MIFGLFLAEFLEPIPMNLSNRTMYVNVAGLAAFLSSPSVRLWKILEMTAKEENPSQYEGLAILLLVDLKRTPVHFTPNNWPFVDKKHLDG